MENRSRRFVLPNLESGQAALKGEKLPPNMRLFIADPKDEKAYPIVTYTWALVRQTYRAGGSEVPEVAQRKLEEANRHREAGRAEEAELSGQRPVDPPREVLCLP